jgi:hypothetical protein
MLGKGSASDHNVEQGYGPQQNCSDSTELGCCDLSWGCTRQTLDCLALMMLLLPSSVC